MGALQNLVQGFSFSFGWYNYMMAAFGTILGIIIGALPGLTATTGVSIFLPLTFYMDPIPSFGFLPVKQCRPGTKARSDPARA